MPNKPMTVLRQEYIDRIINISNEIRLPACVKAEVLKGVYEEMRHLVEQEYQNDLAAYKAALQKESEVSENG